MTTIYKDEASAAIFFEDSNGVQFPNSLQAYYGDGADEISILDISRNIDIKSNFPKDSFLKQNGTAYTGTRDEIIQQLNAVFSNTGTNTTDPPVITSSLSINSVVGSVVNYEMTADYGVAYEWDFSNVTGITTVEGNDRKIVGGSGLAIDTYNIPMKAINYNGEDAQTLVLNVNNPPYANTKSVQFFNQDYLGGNAALLDGTLGRTGNGSGSSDAWTIGFWVKPTNTSSGRVLFYFGSNDVANNGFIEIRLTSSNKVRLQYGSTNNNIKATTSNALSVNTWQYVTLTYDGGTTGSSSTDINNYYSRFTIFVDGVAKVVSNSHSNYGWSGSISGQNFRVGKLVSGNTLNGEKIDELAIFDSDQTSNISDIYNSGTPHDLSQLTTQPKHWWRMGDGDTYPYLQDNGSEANCILEMILMTVANIVNDTP